jgi:RNA polymerase sigma-70 factor (ECF subfamily)
MSASSLQTDQLHRWLDRIAAGDEAAREELLTAVSGRLRRLARKLFHRFSRLQRWADTGDVLQNAELRLLRALQAVRPADVRSFFNLAAEQIRRELLDLVRHFYGPYGLGANHDSDGACGDPEQSRVPDCADDPHDLDQWQAFHEVVARLPEEEREVMGLLYYAGRTQAEAAELLGITVRTVQRRWAAALLRLHGLLRDD